MRAWLVVRVMVVIALIGFGAGAVVVFGGDSDPVPQHADAIVSLGGTDQRRGRRWRCSSAAWPTGW